MMLKVQRLYIFEFLRVLTVLTLGISLIFSVISIVEKVDDFMPYKPSFKLLFLYAINSIPKLLLYTMPMAALLSSLFVFSMAIKRREIVAIKTAGGRMKRLLNPFVALGVCLTLFGFVLGEFIVPTSAKKLQSIASEITKQGRKVTFREGTVYLRGRDGSIIRIGLYLPGQNRSKNISIFVMDGPALKERIDAETGLWEEGGWKLFGVARYDMVRGTVANEKELVFSGIDSPKIFGEQAFKVEEMTLTELVRYTQRLNESGFRNVKLTVDLYSRLAYPIVNMFMLLLGIALALASEQGGLERILRIRLHGGAQANVGAISVGLGLLISVGYWLAYTFVLSLGYAGTLPPMIAPWIVPCLFSAVSLYFYHNIPE